MGQDNIDSHIKQKLEQRTIQSSSEAWDKLSNMLDEETHQGSKNGYFKYAIVASVLLLLGFFFTSEFNGDDSVIIKDEIVEVDNNVKIIDDEGVGEPIVNPFEKEEIVEEYKKEKIEVVVKNETNYTNVESLDKNQIVNQKKEINTIREKVNQYLAQLEKSKQEKSSQEKLGYDIDAEINALLAEASSYLPDKTVKNDVPSFKLDKETDMLLADAFQELNFNPDEDAVSETLKNKLFKQLEKGYLKSRVLLAERSQLARPKEYTSIY